MKYKVKLQNVTKRYRMYNKPSEKIKDLFTWKESGEWHYALRNISFEVPDGEIVGIIGLNGSGKSTLSNLIAGVTIPNEGEVKVNGSAALIAISSGLNPQLTGIENIELKGLMLGLSKAQIKDITPKVMEFAEVGKFIHQPVKTYSSGMKARLGFAISVHIDPDILVVDEALSVGDPTFTDKCLAKMNEFKDNGKTIFFISHSLAQVKSFCTQALWLHYGQVKEYGPAAEVIDHYMGFLKEFNKMTMDERKMMKEEQMKEFEHGLLQDAPVSRKSRKKKRRTPIISLAALALLGGAGTLYMQSKDPVANKQKEGQVSTEKAVLPAQAEKKTDELAARTMSIINGRNVMIRKEPNRESTPVFVADFGEVYTRLGQASDQQNSDIAWTNIQLQDGTSGWVSSQLLQEYQQGRVILQDDKLNALNGSFEAEYGSAFLTFMQYLQISKDELQRSYPVPLNESAVFGNKGIVSSQKVQFTVMQGSVKQISFPRFPLGAAELTKLLGAPSMEDAGKGFSMYETETYYVSVKADGGEGTVLSVVKKQ